MIEAVMFRVMLRMKSGRVYNLEISDMDIDNIFDIMFLREKGNFISTWGEVINVSEVEYMKYTEIEKEEEE